jgi:hypothetical protein
MFKKIVSTIVGGSIGLAALYAVAKIAYSAGQDMAHAEHRYQELDRKVIIEKSSCVSSSNVIEASDMVICEPVKHSKLGTLFSVGKLLGKKNRSVIGDLVSNPEGHQLEAYIKENEIHIDIKKRRTVEGVRK